METMKISDILANAVKSVFKETPAISEEIVREKAYILWEEAGKPEGDGIEFWLLAEQELASS